MRVTRLIPVFIAYLFVLFTSNISAAPNVWDVLRSQFQLNHEVSQPEVQKQIRWLSSHPHYVIKMAQKSQPYIYHIVSELKQKRLPGELALVPMIESAYDPFAYSGAGAAGLWQLMPGTGSGLGLKQDWWYDGRRSIKLSTQAALQYLGYLHKFFNGNWVLAIAAYDSGEGTIRRAIYNSKQKNQKRIHFWSLNIPRETQAYIPRLMALAEIIKYHKYYNIKLPDIPYQPYFCEIDIGNQIELNKAASLADMPYRELLKLNPGYNRWTTAPYGPHRLLIPMDKVQTFKDNLAKIPKEELVNWKKHQVQKGETLSEIAQSYHTTIVLLKELNQLKNTSLKMGQTLLIPAIQSRYSSPSSKKPINLYDRSSPGPQYKVIHIVQPGDSLTILERRYQVQTGQIRYWNQIKGNRPLVPGEQLIIWKKSSDPKNITNQYKIKSGDNLSTIARIFNTTVKRIKQANPGIKADRIKVGQVIKIA